MIKTLIKHIERLELNKISGTTPEGLTWQLLDQLKIQQSMNKPGGKNKRELYVLLGVVQHKYLTIEASTWIETSQQLLSQLHHHTHSE